MPINLDQLKKICPNLSKNADVFIKYLNDTMAKYEINTKPRIAAFIAQIAHESCEFKYTHEIGNVAYFRKYDIGKLATELGNTPDADGDGSFYCGRGLIEITGKANYEAISKDLGVDFVKYPQLLETPQYATISAGWFWNKHGINQYADKPDTWRSPTKKYTPFQMVTYLINPGLNHYAERLAFYQRALSVF